ncbi:MAG: tetraacyldisaccharide 4'-kinase [Bacteroidetes bacterium]|nr:tetraacyldisaccharide 4'-kinase [Bacteroidota bacterium]
MLYSLGVQIRNFLFNKSLRRSQPAAQFSIVVGNLTVGGTGKTPMIEYLIRRLKKDNQVVTLSRGYGRKSRGFQLATAASTAADIGDEPLQYYEKFGKDCKIAVCEDRVYGSNQLKKLFPEAQLLLLDDAFQHRQLRPDLSILLNDYHRPFYEDEPFPGGRLREPRRGAVRADAIVTTKCPTTLEQSEKDQIVGSIRRYAAPNTPVFFSSISYGEICAFGHTQPPPHSVMLVAGIAQPEPLVAYVRENFELSQVQLFPDHHSYTLAEVVALAERIKNEELILTTEKDKVKLRPLAQEAGVLHKFAYLPIRVDFGSDTDRFDAWLRQQLHAMAATGGDHY